MFHSETIKFFRQTGRRRERSNVLLREAKRAKGALQERDAPGGFRLRGRQACLVAAGTQRALVPTVHAVTGKGCCWDGGATNNSGARSPPVGDQGVGRQQEPVSEGLWVGSSLSSVPFRLQEPRIEDGEGWRGGATCINHQELCWLRK